MPGGVQAERRLGAPVTAGPRAGEHLAWRRGLTGRLSSFHRTYPPSGEGAGGHDQVGGAQAALPNHGGFCQPAWSLTGRHLLAVPWDRVLDAPTLGCGLDEALPITVHCKSRFNVLLPSLTSQVRPDVIGS